MMHQADTSRGKRNTKIAAMLAAGRSYSDVQEAFCCSRATVAKIAKRAKKAA
jgi:transposase